MSAMSLTAAIADNHDVTRWGMRSAIEGMQGRVVASVQTGLDAVSAVEEHAPEVLVLSLRLPHLNGLDVLYYLQEKSLPVKTVVLTTSEKERRVREVFGRGAHAYVRKRDSLEEICAAITTVRRGERYLSNALPKSYMAEAGAPEALESDPYRVLTIREREVVQMTAEGYTSREIGEQLGISPRTVEKHRENIKGKLGVRSIVEMADQTYQRGYVPGPRVLRSRNRESRMA
ncbi:hypothetical protein BSZ35_09755 [Salinibacter sp. 10B]|nr:hypothetical protein BSZ35_09755 [Salinibacter sp. 10B]